MRSYCVSVSPEAQDDLERLFEFALHASDEAFARRAIDTIETAFQLLQTLPHSCRKAAGGALGSALRELVIPLGGTGYVALFRILPPDQVQVLAVRHQRESDYH
ncbi:type II toxin-antitoxin system RelE/ParE family toxin [Ottowia testudinis]|uniref:Type II toxin-antitoxin system RelE/ParE family toxin n=1 Tax=Ottowia testudinis TaxID=2816950 RepID=A0A975H2V5_9BURK|nr:type II toxin-antitoxin system RelE/ParE family toxin [Ottowia testudinis]QTD44596.1 type II toxin-antitoxin system RelE/ParE family toxin [Ottowia testudinis]